MSHSHLVVEHLLRQLEDHAAQKRDWDLRPAWLTDFVDAAAAHFEPYCDVARVGYECQFLDELWETRLFLGETEIVGGKEDGSSRSVNFQLDIKGLFSQFDTVHECVWNCFARLSEANTPPRSFLTIEGAVHDQLLRLKVYSRPPESIGPALRMFHDGRCETV